MTNPDEPATAHQQKVMAWFEAMVQTAQAMTPEQRHKLELWEKENLGGSTGTSDWPGWKPLIGSPPWSDK